MVKVYLWFPFVGKPQTKGSVGETMLKASITGRLFKGEVLHYGHAALGISGKLYMSYWPPQEEVCSFTLSYEEDIDRCGREADTIIELDGCLNEKAIVKFWQTERTKDFNDFNHNCCTIVYFALKQGRDEIAIWKVGKQLRATGRTLMHPFKTLSIDNLMDRVEHPKTVIEAGPFAVTYSKACEPEVIRQLAEYLALLYND